MRPDTAAASTVKAASLLPRGTWTVAGTVNAEAGVALSLTVAGPPVGAQLSRTVPVSRSPLWAVADERLTAAACGAGHRGSSRSVPLRTSPPPSWALIRTAVSRATGFVGTEKATPIRPALTRTVLGGAATEPPDDTASVTSALGAQVRSARTTAAVPPTTGVAGAVTLASRGLAQPAA